MCLDNLNGNYGSPIYSYSSDDVGFGSVDGSNGDTGTGGTAATNSSPVEAVSCFEEPEDVPVALTSPAIPVSDETVKPVTVISTPSITVDAKFVPVDPVMSPNTTTLSLPPETNTEAPTSPISPATFSLLTSVPIWMFATLPPTDPQSVDQKGKQAAPESVPNTDTEEDTDTEEGDTKSPISKALTTANDALKTVPLVAPAEKAVTNLYDTVRNSDAVNNAVNHVETWANDVRNNTTLNSAVNHVESWASDVWNNPTLNGAANHVETWANDVWNFKPVNGVVDHVETWANDVWTSPPVKALDGAAHGFWNGFKSLFHAGGH
jgi:hypothetical protein